MYLGSNCSRQLRHVYNQALSVFERSIGNMVEVTDGPVSH